MLDKLLPKLKEAGHRVLIFSQFTSMLDILQDYCNYRGHNNCRLDGSTNRVQRKLDIDSFNSKNSDLFVFLISTRAGGLGINLATADTIILYDTDWNPQVDLQAQDRVHRIGQTKPVTVYRFITEGTVEERILQIAQRKLYLDAMVLGKNSSQPQKEEDDENDIMGDDGKGTQLSKKELLSMVMFGANAIFNPSSEKPTEEDIDAILKYSQQHDQLAKANNNLQQAENLNLQEDLFCSYVFQGVDHRQPNSKASSEQSITEEWKSLPMKRLSKQRTLQVDGHTVLKENMYTLEDGLCNPAYVPDSAKEENIQKRKKEAYDHQSDCHKCKRPIKKDKRRANAVLECQICPRAYHFNCLAPELTLSTSNFWRCPQHKCMECQQPAAAVGGMLFRCTNCDNTYCEEHLPYGAEIIGKDHDLAELGYIRQATSCFIKCAECSEESAAIDSASSSSSSTTTTTTSSTSHK